MRTAVGIGRPCTRDCAPCSMCPRLRTVRGPRLGVHQQRLHGHTHHLMLPSLQPWVRGTCCVWMGPRAGVATRCASVRGLTNAGPRASLRRYGVNPSRYGNAGLSGVDIHGAGMYTRRMQCGMYTEDNRDCEGAQPPCCASSRRGMLRQPHLRAAAAHWEALLCALLLTRSHCSARMQCASCRH